MRFSRREGALVQAMRSDAAAAVDISATTVAGREAGSLLKWQAWVDGVSIPVSGEHLIMPYLREKARLVLRVELFGADGKRRGSDERGYDGTARL